jgi:GntR family transcriptional regulator
VTELDLDGPIPLYRQLADILRARIGSGELPAGRPVPSELTLTQTFGVSRDTARHALLVLREEGLVITVQGKGTYVADPGAETSP